MENCSFLWSLLAIYIYIYIYFNPAITYNDSRNKTMKYYNFQNKNKNSLNYRLVLKPCLNEKIEWKNDEDNGRVWDLARWFYITGHMHFASKVSLLPQIVIFKFSALRVRSVYTWVLASLAKPRTKDLKLWIWTRALRTNKENLYLRHYTCPIQYPMNLQTKYVCPCVFEAPTYVINTHWLK